MRMVEVIISDCCGDEVQGYDFCRCCLEHCTPILEYYPDPTDPENILKDSGRGIHIMKSFIDELTYNFTPSGTETILVIKLD